MDIPYYHIDAFAREPFTGNPAGVCLLDEWLDDILLQKIAAENNLSETAFLVRAGKNYALRWFTPTMEIDLCGHGTLASGFVLHLVHKEFPSRICFETRSGLLSVTRQGECFYLDFPARPALACSVPTELIAGLGAAPRAVLKARDYLAVFESEEQIQLLRPDFAKLSSLDCFGIIVTAPGKKVDFVSRFFAPGAGIKEDPVTGSSHCTLIPYWSEQTGKKKFVARQLSERGGELLCENQGERVSIGGRAFLFSEGNIQLNSI